MSEKLNVEISRKGQKKQQKKQKKKKNNKKKKKKKKNNNNNNNKKPHSIPKAWADGMTTQNTK